MDFPLGIYIKKGRTRSRSCGDVKSTGKPKDSRPVIGVEALLNTDSMRPGNASQQTVLFLQASLGFWMVGKPWKTFVVESGYLLLD